MALIRIALLLPLAASLVACDGGCLITFCELVPAVANRLVALGLAVERGHLTPAPVGILDDAVPVAALLAVLNSVGTATLADLIDRGAGNLVVAVRRRGNPVVVDNASIAGSDMSRNAIPSRRRLTARARNHNLSAANVPLSTTNILSLMKGKRLGTDNVITTRKILGDINLEEAAVLDKALRAKLAVLETFVIDLEPTSAGGRGCSSVVNLLHVNSARA